MSTVLTVSAVYSAVLPPSLVVFILNIYLYINTYCIIGCAVFLRAIAETIGFSSFLQPLLRNTACRQLLTNNHSDFYLFSCPWQLKRWHYHWLTESVSASFFLFFCTRKRPFSVILGAKKWDFGCPNPKTETTFCRQLSPKMVEQTLVSHEYHFRASFGQILKIAYFRLIFGLFPIVKL